MRKDQLKIAHIFVAGNIGGIECLCRDYIQYSEHEHIILVLWGDGPILDELKKQGIRVIYLNFSRKNVLGGYKKVRDICENEHVDVIVAEHEAIQSHIILMLFRHFKTRMKTVAYAHCHASFMCREKERRGLVIRKMILARSLASADCVVAISDAVANSLVQYFKTNRSHIRVTYNGIILPHQSGEGQETYQFGKTGKNIIYVGRLIEEKGVQTIIGAMRLLDDTYHLDIVGDGIYRKHLEELCHGLEDRVIFHGFQTDVQRYLSKASVFVHVPECEEGFGLTVVESMVAGNICIVGNRGAMSELVNNGEDGFLIESGDSRRLADKIRYIFEDMSDADRSQMIRNAQKKAGEFSIECYTKKMDALYSSICTKKEKIGE